MLLLLGAKYFCYKYESQNNELKEISILNTFLHTRWFCAVIFKSKGSQIGYKHFYYKSFLQDFILIL